MSFRKTTRPNVVLAIEADRDGLCSSASFWKAARRRLSCLNCASRPLFPKDVAPGLNRIGVMLPNTPMHHQFFEGRLECLVMTSGNLSEEPVEIRNDQAQTRLAPLVDRFLLHDRDIFMRTDDSVTRWYDGAPRIIRRARGYAPNLGS
jgi:hydrogenase maturation protein HypF